MFCYYAIKVKGLRSYVFGDRSNTKICASWWFGFHSISCCFSYLIGLYIERVSVESILVVINRSLPTYSFLLSYTLYFVLVCDKLLVREMLTAVHF